MPARSSVAGLLTACAASLSCRHRWYPEARNLTGVAGNVNVNRRMNRTPATVVVSLRKPLVTICAREFIPKISSVHPRSDRSMSSASWDRNLSTLRRMHKLQVSKTGFVSEHKLNPTFNFVIVPDFVIRRVFLSGVVIYEIRGTQLRKHAPAIRLPSLLQIRESAIGLFDTIKVSPSRSFRRRPVCLRDALPILCRNWTFPLVSAFGLGRFPLPSEYVASVPRRFPHSSMSAAGCANSASRPTKSESAAISRPASKSSG